jgi:hypothetical protein
MNTTEKRIAKSGLLLWDQKESKFLNNNTPFDKFQKTEVRGHGNQHDWTRATDLKIGQDYIKNGIDNFFPNDIIGAVKKSMLQKRAYHTISNVAAGKVVFQNPDGSAVSEGRTAQLNEIYKGLGITRKDFIKPVTRSNYLFGGTPVTMDFTSDGFGFGLSTVTKRDYKTMRLSFPAWNKVSYFYDKHFYHKDWGYRNNARNKRVSVSSQTKSWIEWNEDPKKNFENACFFFSYEPDRDLSNPLNRVQSFLIQEPEDLSDFYPLPVWFSGTTFNYIRSEFLLSCFDIDDIENGLHASGIVKVFHKSYKNPESGEAIQTFEKHKKMVESKFRGGWNSGSITIVPVALDGGATSDSISFEPITTNNNKERHEILDTRIKQNILSGNGAIYSELFGIRDDKSTFAEGDGKLLVGLKLLNEFTIKPLKSLLDDPDSGFLNMVNDILGIEERSVIAPNLAAFLNIAPDLAKHFLHPDQWFDMLQDFGLSRPTIEQQRSGLIPAYVPVSGR